VSRKSPRRTIYAFTASDPTDALKERIREAAKSRNLLYKDTEDGFDLGVARGGHSGGYWYVATLTEADEQTFVSGQIVYRSYHSDGKLREETKWEKILGWIGVSLIVLIAAPAILIGLAVWGIMELIGKLRGRPSEATMTDGEKLTRFMTEAVGCRVEK
jgi:hypothetical protein